MTFTLPSLPYAKDALAPHISVETIEYHYGKHHQTCVNNLNQLIPNTEFANKTLEEIIQTATGGIFNNAAQIWNHTFYWNCLSPNSKPSAQLINLLAKNFGSAEKFKEEFTKAALSLFGSGWVWLVKNPDNTLAITSLSNAGNPLTTKQTPLLTCDIWEHAYYIDYRNARAKYLEAFWQIVNWEFVEKIFNSKF